jgi:phospholipase/carboxylesterase
VTQESGGAKNSFRWVNGTDSDKETKESMIEYREHPAETGTGTAGMTVIMLHGFGANATDLYSLHSVIDPEGRYRWIFPEAPYHSALLGGGQAWFPRDEAAIMRTLTDSYFTNLAAHDPDGLRQAADEITVLAEALKIDWSRTTLAGFSQGAMVSTECVVGQGIRPAGLGVFSGAMVAAERWRRMAEQRVADLPVFHSHGEADPILSYRAGRDLAEFLTTAGADLTSVSFPGGHEIPEQAVAGFIRFVRDLV